MSFKLKVKKIGETPVLHVHGDITGGDIGKMTEKLENLMQGSWVKIGIDLSDVSFIDSHGLGVFVFFYRRLHDVNRELVIINPSEFITDLFSGSNLDKIFTIVNSEDAL